jgi:hypothetical protein
MQAGLDDEAGGAVERSGAEAGEGVSLARDGGHVCGGAATAAMSVEEADEGGVEGLEGQAIICRGGVDAQLHVSVEVGPQAALDALEGLNTGGKVDCDALHVGGDGARG